MEIAQAIAFGALLKKLNILVVDDFQGMRTMLRGIMREMGCVKVDTASNGREAINQLRLLRYDIVICDYNLGDGPNGQHVLEEAKLNDLLSPAAVWIMVTAEKTSDMVMGTAEVRPDDYILKPVNQETLENRLEKLILRKQAMVAIEREIKARKYMNALEECDALIAKAPANLAEILRIKTDVLLTLGRYDEARPIFESVQAQRSVAWAKTGLGKVCFQEGKLDEAERNFREVLDENRIYMEAYDWLVKTLQAKGDLSAAQKVLQSAVQISPNSANRQKTLGEVSHQNGDLALAQAAYEKTLKISEHSPYKSAASYAGLAKVLVEGNNPEQALKVLGKGKKDFKGNDSALMETALVEGTVLQGMGQTDKAQEAIKQARELGQKIGNALDPRLTMEMAGALFAVGDKEAASAMLRDLVRNNHDSQAITTQVQALFEQASLGHEGSSIIEQARQHVINVNNQGVALGREGKFDEAAALLREALHEMPHSETIMMNLCGLLIVMVKKAGASKSLAAEIHGLLDRVHDINPTNKRHQEYSAMLKGLSL